MSPRAYRMNRRADSASHTRLRIVEATFRLHLQKGVAGTTFRDIASGADVGIGTVYHHFPTYADVIAACAQHAFTSASPPRPAIFEGVTRSADRVHVLVRELYSFYRRLPGASRIRAERARFAVLDRAFAHEEEARRALIAEALRGSHSGTHVRALAFALLDMDVYDNLLSSGLPHEQAIREITDVLLARMRAKRRHK